jgi:hypothetical protein
MKTAFWQASLPASQAEENNQTNGLEHTNMAIESSILTQYPYSRSLDRLRLQLVLWTAPWHGKLERASRPAPDCSLCGGNWSVPPAPDSASRSSPRLHTALHAARPYRFAVHVAPTLECCRLQLPQLSKTADCSSRSARRATKAALPLQTAARASHTSRRVRLPFLAAYGFCKIPARQGPARALPARPRPTPCTALMAKICHPGDTGMRRKSMAVSNPTQRAINARRQLGG